MRPPSVPTRGTGHPSAPSPLEAVPQCPDRFETRGSGVAQLDSGPLGADQDSLAIASDSKCLHRRLLVETQTQLHPLSGPTSWQQDSVRSCALLSPSALPQLLSAWLSGEGTGSPLTFPERLMRGNCAPLSLEDGGCGEIMPLTHSPALRGCPWRDLLWVVASGGSHSPEAEGATVNHLTG